MRRLSAALLILAPLLAIGAVLATGEIFSSAAPALIGDAPAALHAKTVRIAAPGGHVAGWLRACHIRGRCC